MSRAAPVVLAALALTGCVATPAPTPGATPTPAASGTPSASAAPTPSATPTPARTTALVYFVVDTDRGLRLAREPRQVDALTPARGALEAMIAGPDDPDYTSAWPRATRVLGINRSGGLVTVDLSAEAADATVGAEGEAALQQQLVWTVTQALDPAASVLVTIEGEPASWGHLVWNQPVRRGDPLGVRLMVGIDAPAQGATLTSPVRVSGEANVFEANLLWRVLRGDGTVVDEGNTSTSEGMVFAPWQLELALPAGTYTVEVSEEDASGAEGSFTPQTDSRVFTVS